MPGTGSICSMTMTKCMDPLFQDHFGHIIWNGFFELECMGFFNQVFTGVSSTSSPKIAFLGDFTSHHL